MWLFATKPIASKLGCGSAAAAGDVDGKDRQGQRCFQGRSSRQQRPK